MNDKKTTMLKWLNSKDSTVIRLVFLLIGVFIFCAILKPRLFLSSNNFVSISKQFPELGILALGISIAMISGGIDLSGVSIANLSSVLSAFFLIKQVSSPAGAEHPLLFILLTVALSLCIGCVCGGINGFLIAVINIPPILATLGSSLLYTGIAIVITGGKTISGLPLLYSRIGNSSLFSVIPVPLILFAAVAAFSFFILEKTKFGKELYLAGTNMKAAFYSGVQTVSLLIKTYALAGILAACSGLIMMARYNSTKADQGSSYTMQCILIAVLGGVNPNGGKGSVLGIVLAVIILQFLSTTLNMFENLSNFYRDIIWGLILIAVLVSNYFINQIETKKYEKQ
ncbi:ABC transporter permease [Treponema phagedenis]|nr:ABC transporter permease [Treponema phagedenis]NVP23848.1 ABC transporter permease [Treponema phagedenis]QKS93490.1 ABC transporter permease [Treponema phagedenis]QLC59391.1 ABC transporter permease [Treponema phagedenis]CEM61802.1 Branched-chain amino acid ABC transporter, permease protein [Treponema phagedenis]